MDPVDKFPAADDAAVYEIAGPIAKAIEFTEFKVSLLLPPVTYSDVPFCITNAALFVEELAVIG